MSNLPESSGDYEAVRQCPHWWRIVKHFHSSTGFVRRCEVCGAEQEVGTM